MTYTPNSPAWDHDTPITVSRLNNMETQYAEGLTYYQAHTHDTDYYTRTEMEANFWYNGNDGAGSGMDADLIYTSSGNLHWGDLSIVGAPDGVIMLWHGAIGDIPSGWSLCDGSGGTRNLEQYWPVCAGSTFAVGATGGANTNVSVDIINVSTHSVTSAEMPSHRHAWTDKHAPLTTTSNNYEGTTYGGEITYHNGTTNATGSGTAHGHTSSTCTTTGTENRPPSKAVYYIQKTT